MGNHVLFVGSQRYPCKHFSQKAQHKLHILRMTGNLKAGKHMHHVSKHVPRPCPLPDRKDAAPLTLLSALIRGKGMGPRAQGPGPRARSPEPLGPSARDLGHMAQGPRPWGPGPWRTGPAAMAWDLGPRNQWPGSAGPLAGRPRGMLSDASIHLRSIKGGGDV